MDMTKALVGLMNSYGGPLAACKVIVDQGEAPCSEAELVGAISEFVGGDMAFAKLYEGDVTVRKAIAIAKAETFAEQLLSGGLPVSVVGGEDARDVDDPQAALDAYARLLEIGKARWPNASEATQFANAFTENPALAQKAHRRPSATTSYPFPR